MSGAMPQTTDIPPAAVRPPSATRERSTAARTLGELVLRAGERHSGPVLRYKRGSEWAEVDYRDLARAAREIARGLIELGIEPGHRVAVLSDTRAEWTLADFGALCAGAVVAPVYQTNSPEECAYVLGHSDARAVFCENEGQLAKVEQVRGQCPALEHVIAFEGAGAGSIALDELRGLGAGVPEEAVDERVRAAAPDDLATLIYTSGTTGPPKGCMLTHDNFLSATRAYEEVLDLVSADVPIVFYMFLPLAHSLARLVQMAVVDLGGTLVYWQRDPRRLLDDLREARPTYLPSVPRLFEKVYTAAHSRAAEQPRPQRAAFHWAVAAGARVRRFERRGRRIPPALALAHRLGDRLVLAKVRELFGGRLVLAASGAAPIAKETLEFFDACGVLVLEGWGLTETSAAGTINTPQALRFGTVGRPLPETEVRVAGDGELLVRGPCVFQGYFKNEEATREALDGGWFATGDLGTVDGDGFVSITGRKKDIIITSSGKNITPSNIENRLKESRWIAEAVVYGDERPYLVALLTLDPEEAPALAQRLGVPADPAAMARHARVHAELAKEVERVNARFARIEQIKRFAILERQLTQAAGELTPTFKVKRNVVYEEFADRFEQLYAAG
jgi:long-chain acyl-CoA synthetase